MTVTPSQFLKGKFLQIGFLCSMNRIQNIIRKQCENPRYFFLACYNSAYYITLFSVCRGKNFQKNRIGLDNLHIDKFVHIGLFSVLVFLWILPPQEREVTNKR